MRWIGHNITYNWNIVVKYVQQDATIAFFIRNGFTLHVSGDNLTHHQEYNVVYVLFFKTLKKNASFPFNNANNFPLLNKKNYALAWKGEHTDSSRKQLNCRTLRTTYLTSRHRASSIQDRRFDTLQRTLFIYLINKYISLSDICLTVHH